MNKNELKELDDFIVYKNTALLTLAITAHILSKSLYGTDAFQNDSNAFSNVIPIIESYRSSYFNDKDYDVDMDLLVNISTTVYHKYGETKKYDDIFTFHLIVTVNNGVKTPKILGLVEGDQLRSFDKKKSLSKKLIPYIYKENYDEVALEFLSKYCKGSLENPIPLPTDEIINDLGFNVVYAELNQGDKGLFAFRSQEAFCYNQRNKCIEKKSINANSILIDYTLESRKGYGAVNNTKIHELLHWFLHKKYIEFGLVLKSGITSISTNEDHYAIAEIDYDNFSEIKVLEEQCKNITPLILMPKGPATAKFSQLLNYYSKYAYSEAYELAITDFASFFRVTKMSAKIRLRALGYSEQPTNIDKKYLLSSNGQTRFISFYDFKDVLSSSEQLSDWYEKQFIKYVDGYVVINLPGFIERDGDRNKLSKLALNHLNECTLKFNSKIVSGIHNNVFEYMNLYSSESTAKTITMNVNEIERVVNMYKNCKNIKAQKDFFKDYRNEEANKYSEYLITLMERHNVSIRGLAKESNVSKSVIDKYRSYTEAPYTEAITLKLCAGMHAYPYETLNLLKLMGIDLEYSIHRDIATDRNKCYYYLITNMYDDGIEKWNEYLEAHKQPKL